MALAYGTRLRAEPAADPNDQVRQVAEAVGSWARIGGPLSEMRVADPRRDGTIETTVLGEQWSERWAWRLRMLHPDREDPDLNWSVSVVCIRDGASTEVTVRLDLSRRSGALARQMAKPAPPGCVAALLDYDGVSFTDGGRRLGTGVWVVDRSEAQPLATLVRSTDRRLPIFAFTPRDEDPIDGGWLLPKAIGLAHVVLVKSDASWELNQLLPDGLNVYGGAARLWWPGVTDESTKFDHQLWTGSVEARRTTGSALNAILEAGRTASVLDHRVLEFERRRQDERAAELQRKLAEARRAAAEAREHASTDASTESTAGEERAESRVREAEEKLISELRKDADTAFGLAATHEEEAREARERAEGAERERDFLRYEVARLRGLLDDGDASEIGAEKAGVEAEIRAEIALRGEVDGAVNRAMRLGSVFASTLEAHGPKYRQKAIKACADVVIASPSLLGRRDDHILRTGDGANDPQRMRSSDGAGARRCYLEQKVPAARRLHYWLLEDGSVELASVNVHDDMNIPE